MATANEANQMTHVWTDLYLDRDVSNRALIEAGASAFDVPVTAVQVVEPLTATARALWNSDQTHLMFRRDETDDDGEFRIRFNLGLKENAALHLIDRLGQLARHLGVAFITDFETPEYTDSQWRLVAPDGWSGIVTVDDDAFNRDAFVLTPEARALLDVHTPPSSVRHVS